MRFVVWAAMVVSAAAPAQTPGAKPQFEVASVRPAAIDAGASQFAQRMRGLTGADAQLTEIPLTGSDRMRLRNWSLAEMIAAAYRMRPSQVSGPAWMSDAHFDVEAKLPDGAAKGDLNAMLQSLLEERFGLKVHRHSQTEQGFALVVGKDGAKMKLAGTPQVAPEDGLSDEEKRARMEAKMKANLAAIKDRMAETGGGTMRGWGSITAEELAAQLVQFAGAPVVDETGLTGSYSVRIEIAGNPNFPGGTVFDAVEKLGLKLEPGKVTVETVVVDQVSKVPTAN